MTDVNKWDINDATLIQSYLAALYDGNDRFLQRTGIIEASNPGVSDVTLIQEYLARISTDYDDVLGKEKDYIEKWTTKDYKGLRLLLNRIDIVDGTLIQRQIVELYDGDESFCQRASFVNPGEPSITDVTIIQQFLANIPTDYDKIIGTKQYYK